MAIRGVSVVFMNASSNGWLSPIDAKLSRYEYAFDAAEFGLSVGDLCVVEKQGNFTLVVVAEVHDSPKPKATEWIVDRVEVDHYRAAKARREETEALLKKADEILRKGDRVDRLRRLAMSGDSDAQGLLKRLEELGMAGKAIEHNG